jgi:hypothetical protein
MRISIYRGVSALVALTFCFLAAVFAPWLLGVIAVGGVIVAVCAVAHVVRFRFLGSQAAFTQHMADFVEDGEGNPRRSADCG